MLPAASTVPPAPVTETSTPPAAELTIAPLALPAVPLELPATPPLRSDTPAAAARPLWRAVAGHVANLAIAAALGLVTIFCAIVVGLVATGHHLEQVVTGSMQPTIPIGSMVVTEQLPAAGSRSATSWSFPTPTTPS